MLFHSTGVRLHFLFKFPSISYLLVCDLETCAHGAAKTGICVLWIINEIPYKLVSL